MAVAGEREENDLKKTAGRRERKMIWGRRLTL
jgi:hypothetical protein